MSDPLTSIFSESPISPSPSPVEENSSEETKATQEPNAATDKLEDAILSLRRKLEEESLTPDAIIVAIPEVAKALTGADGVAIALRSHGAIICRARSGDLAPAVGATLDLQSGISGECLRTGSVLLCNDAAKDSRVDADVCQSMGLQSLIAVPLRGPVGTAGILEVFSRREEAFADDHSETLQQLALIAETAYERERRTHDEETLAMLRGTRRSSPVFNRPSDEDNNEPAVLSLDEFEAAGRDAFSTRRYWIMGMLALAILLMLGVWLSWRKPMADLTDMDRAHASSTAAENSTPAIEEVSEEPKPAALRIQDQPAKKVVKKAAKVEKTGTGEQPTGGVSESNRPAGASNAAPGVEQQSADKSSPENQ